MREVKAKHCNTCLYSYYTEERTGIGTAMRQRCRNPAYNAPSYTHDMLMEDWDLGHCRFWVSQTQKG